jgi:transcription antitermination factor NusG
MEGAPRKHGSERRRSVLERRWRVFYTAPRAEKACETRIQERGIDVFLPKYSALRRWSDRKKEVIEPLFPNYIFAHVDEAGRLGVLRTPGIVRCVTFEGRPADVSEEEIEQLKILQQAPGRLALTAYRLPDVGTPVTVVEGPLRGLRGDVVEHRGQLHIVVQVNAIRQVVWVHLPVEAVVAERQALLA